MVICRQRNEHYRSREYLTLAKVNRLIMAAELRGRHPIGDKALVLLGLFQVPEKKSGTKIVMFPDPLLTYMDFQYC